MFSVENQTPLLEMFMVLAHAGLGDPLSVQHLVADFLFDLKTSFLRRSRSLCALNIRSSLVSITRATSPSHGTLRSRGAQDVFGYSGHAISSGPANCFNYNYLVDVDSSTFGPVLQPAAGLGQGSRPEPLSHPNVGTSAYPQNVSELLIFNTGQSDLKLLILKSTQTASQAVSPLPPPTPLSAGPEFPNSGPFHFSPHFRYPQMWGDEYPQNYLQLSFDKTRQAGLKLLILDQHRQHPRR